MEHPKKRHRVPASCSVCRKRKSKCDRIKPVCGTCKKKSIAHLCYYEGDSKDPTSSTVSINEIIPLPVPNQFQAPPDQQPLPHYYPIPQALPPPPPHLQPTTVMQHQQPPPQQFKHNQLQGQVPNQLIPPPQHQIPPPGLAAQPVTQSQPPSSSTASNITNGGNNKSINQSNNSINTNNNQIGFHSPTSTSNLSPGSQVPFSQTQSNNQTPLIPQQSQSVKSQSISGSPPNHNISNVTSFSSSPLVAIPLGSNSTLQVNPDDQMNIFTNASYSLNLEGSLWQVQGTLSYIGLTKSDPFIKVLRNYAVLLFKSGEMTKFIKTETVRRRKRSIYSSSGVPSASTPKRPKVDSFATSSLGPSPSSLTMENEQKKDIEDPEDLVEADALIVTQIKVNKDDDDDDEEEDEDGEDSNKITGHDVDPSNIKAGASSSTNDKNGHCSSDVISMLPNLRRSLFSGKKSRSEYFKLIEKIVISILPNKLNMFMLFCRFFKYCHPFIPILDENSLLIELNTLLDNFPNFTRDYYTEISIENENDLNVIGILLVILRIGYMSLIHNDDVNNVYTDDEKSMIMDMKRVNSENFTSISNICISDELIAVKSSFRLVQHLALVYFYRQVAPDDCHGLGGADSNILFGVIVRHAMSIGLNRDPSFYVAHDVIIKREALIKSWRNLWNYILTTDAVSAIHAGTTLNIPNIEICDVELPLVDEDKSGHFNDTIRRIQTICESYRNIVKRINNVHNKPRVIEMLLETNQLEKIFFDFFGKDFFKDFICKPAKVPEDGSSFESGSKDHEESFLKVIKFCTFIQLRTNLSCMYYMIAIHYENEYNESRTPSMNAGIELFKIYIKSVVQLVYIMSYVLDNSVELFGKGYDYYLTANNERCMIKTHSFLTSFFARLLHYKMNLTLSVRSDPSIKPKLDVTDSLFSMVLIESELFVGNFRKLSRTYINSYKLYVMTYFVLMQCMENPSVFFQTSIQYPRFFHKGTNMLEFFTISELHYLCKLCEDFRSAKEGQQKFKNAKVNQLQKSDPTKQSATNAAGDPLQKAFGHPAPPSSSNISTSSIYNTYANNMSKDGFQTKSHLSQFNSQPPLNSAEASRNIYDIFDQPNLGGEDILKLFEVYGDLDKEL
ncbi:hypothetical protein DFJ63DRAFT_287151 [Scheffersomyces coipomensis]|uniref:uncharacterized protein n=1 Tax=Scheffersomyces coipomensis TaxID=1788519 RepID=UPI00315D27D2